MKRALLLFLAVLAVVAFAQTPRRARAIVEWDHNDIGETAFELERSTDGVRFHLIALLPPNTLTYTDRMLRAGVTYTYRVRAVYGRDRTEYSNTATGTVPSDAVSSRQQSL